MLRKVYYHVKGEKTRLVFVETKNFKISRVFNPKLEMVELAEDLIESIQQMILNNLHFGDNVSSDDAEYHIELGEMLDTPSFL